MRMAALSATTMLDLAEFGSKDFMRNKAVRRVHSQSPTMSKGFMVTTYVN